jgi:archaeal preflagellin peptidase FlaK
VVLVLGGFAYAAFSDLRTREVTDRLWQVLGVLGLAIGTIAVSPGGPVPVISWLLVAGLTLEHMFPWDDLLAPDSERLADLIEGMVYAGVVLGIVVLGLHSGVGPSGVPLAAVALLATVLFARALFEVGVLYGGADAKALMIAGILLPIFSSPLLPQTASEAFLAGFLPYSVNLLVDAALISVVIPLGIAARNLGRGEFSFRRGFSEYTIPVRELPDRWVWLKNPMRSDAVEEREAETSEDDRRLRTEAARRLEAAGVERVWVTPQIPFVVLMAAGAVAALLAGNLILDILSAV